MLWSAGCVVMDGATAAAGCDGAMLPAPHAPRPAMSDEQRTQMQAARMEILPSRLCCTSTQQPWHDVVVERQGLRVSFKRRTGLALRRLRRATAYVKVLTLADVGV